MKSLKRQYHKTTYAWRCKEDGRWSYCVRWGYGRSILRTTQTCRRFDNDEADIRYDPDWVRFRVRRRRSDHALNAWNIEPPVSRSGGKSWKDYTRNRKQWMKVKVVEDDWHDRFCMRAYRWIQAVALTDL